MIVRRNKTSSVKMAELPKKCMNLLLEFVSDVQTFIEVKQHPQAGPETPHTMCEKFEDFWKNLIFDFLNFSHGPMG